MHLRSITLKGFKSFPDRTKLEFGRGVSVVVGPNGSGKSNVTDAVLWAMGEQSPLAVRGQSMRDVIFGGGRGVQARSAAEVEIVIDNADGAVDMPMGEISILRRLERSGEGEYRLNGARCRLVDILEVLSDTGLGKEMHSVVSQGRVESIVTSKPRDRRLLIEEAAGLGKHRKRRRRAQLKLERTQDNLDRALDVEREARSRLRPLKRQAEAAELHERLERQTVEARWELVRDLARARRASLAQAETAAATARADREQADAQLGEVGARREQAERALAQRSEQREAFAARVYAARSAAERVALHLQRADGAAEDLHERAVRRARELQALQQEQSGAAAVPAAGGARRIAELEAELERSRADHEAELDRELAALEQARVAAAAKVAKQHDTVTALSTTVATAVGAADQARQERRDADQAVERARRESAAIGAELAACNQFLRTRARAGATSASAHLLAERIEVQHGYERALAAVLGGLLRAALVDELREGAALLDAAGSDGGRALVAGGPAPAGAAAPTPPAPGARPLADVIGGEQLALAAASRLLVDVWLVEQLDRLAPDFAGIAVTREGRVWHGGRRELRQGPEGGEERVLAERNRRETLIAASTHAVAAEQAALALREGAEQVVSTADGAREDADRALRDGSRALAAAEEDAHRAGWLIDQRRAAPLEGAAAVRRAQLDGELAAERRLAEQAARQHAERERRIAGLRRSLQVNRELVPLAERLASTLANAAAAIGERVSALEAELAADRAAGEDLAARLRACATEEAEIQRRLRECGDAVTSSEVRAQQARDQAAETEHELGALARRLGLAAQPAAEALDDEQADALHTRIERLQRRREQLGPVNPLAKDEYEAALAHVTELEDQRTDLETAMRELRSLISETDRQIHATFEQTFEAAARNFEELAGQLFPGGRGRLRLVKEASGITGFAGEPAAGDDGAGDAHAHADAAAEAEAAAVREEDLLGVEIEITPAGKSMKRLTLLSGGEKSMTAIAFLFAVFLARPCPFYILDEVEAALDDPNITRFLELLRRYADRAQFIVVTHQKRTMEAADTLYGVSMGDDGVSKVISRRLPREEGEAGAGEPAAGAA